MRQSELGSKARLEVPVLKDRADKVGSIDLADADLSLERDASGASMRRNSIRI